MYNSDNSLLPDNDIISLTSDSQVGIWIGMCPDWDGSAFIGGGLVKYDGENWEIYTDSNSGLPDNLVTTIAIDSKGNKWIGTKHGLAEYRKGGIIPSSMYDKYIEELPAQIFLFQNYVMF